MPLRRIKKHFPQPLSALLVISCSYLFCTTFCTTSYTLLTSCLRVTVLFFIKPTQTNMDRNSNARSWFLHMQRFSIRSPVVFSLLILRQKTKNRNVDYIDTWTLISGYSELPGYTAIAWSSAIPQNPQEFIHTLFLNR